MKEKRKWKKRLFRLDEAAAWLNVSKSTVKRRIEEGHLVAYSSKKNGIVHIPIESLEAYETRRIREYMEEKGISVPYEVS